MPVEWSGVAFYDVIVGGWWDGVRRQVIMLPLLRVLGKLASKCDATEDRDRLVASGVPRLVVRLMGWARAHDDTAVMMQVGTVV
jgi:hypothetical protein